MATDSQRIKNKKIKIKINPVLSKCGEKKEKSDVFIESQFLSKRNQRHYNRKADSNCILAYIIPIYCTS